MTWGVTVSIAPVDWQPDDDQAGDAAYVGGGWLKVEVTRAEWTNDPRWVRVAYWADVPGDCRRLAWSRVRLSALPVEVQRMLPYQPNPTPERIQDVRVEVVGYRDEDGDEPVRRVDVIDTRTLTTLLSLPLKDALHLAHQIQTAAQPSDTDWPLTGIAVTQVEPGER